MASGAVEHPLLERRAEVVGNDCEIFVTVPPIGRVRGDELVGVEWPACGVPSPYFPLPQRGPGDRGGLSGPSPLDAASSLITLHKRLVVWPVHVLWSNGRQDGYDLVVVLLVF